MDLDLLYEAPRSHSDTPQSVELLWTVISSSQRPLPDNTQQSHDTDFHPPVGFEPAIPAIELVQNNALYRAATEIGVKSKLYFGNYLQILSEPELYTSLIS